MITDLALCAQSAAAYDRAAPGTRLHWQDMSALVTEEADGFVMAVEGTDPRNWLNLIRDANVASFPMKDDPELGPIPEGAEQAAVGFLPMIEEIVGSSPWNATGHSLGGQVAVILAARMRQIGKPPLRLVPFDPPKSGGPMLAKVLADVPGQPYAFNGSIVTHWPFFEGHQFRAPIVIGDHTFDLLEAHSITRALAWMQAHTKQLVTT